MVCYRGRGDGPAASLQLWAWVGRPQTQHLKDSVAPGPAAPSQATRLPGCSHGAGSAGTGQLRTLSPETPESALALGNEAAADSRDRDQAKQALVRLSPCACQSCTLVLSLGPRERGSWAGGGPHAFPWNLSSWTSGCWLGGKHGPSRCWDLPGSSRHTAGGQRGSRFGVGLRSAIPASPCESGRHRKDGFVLSDLAGFKIRRWRI